MDIKLKKFNDRLLVRVCAFILCVGLMLTSAITVFIGGKTITGMGNSLFSFTISDISGNNNFFESSTFAQWLSATYENMGIILKFGNREDIKDGKFIDEEKFNDELEDYYYDSAFSDGLTLENSQFFEVFGGIPNSETTNLKSFDEMKERFIKEYPNVVKNIKNQIIQTQLEVFDRAKYELEQNDDIGYSIAKDKIKIENNYLPDNVAGMIIKIENRKISVYPETSGVEFLNIHLNERIYDSEMIGTDEETNKDAIFKLSFSRDFVQDINNDFAYAKQIYEQSSIIIAATLIGALFVLIYLVLTTGRKDEHGKVRLYRSDRLYTEIQILVVCGLCAAAVLPAILFIRIFDNLNMSSLTTDISFIAFMIFAVGLELIIFTGILWFFLSIVRTIKANTFFKRSLLVMAVKTIYKWVKAAFSKANPMGKFIIIIIAASLLCMTRVLAPLAVILLLGFGYRWIKKYTAVKKGIEQVINGNLEYKIPVDENSLAEFDTLARQINTIAKASNIAIQNELKNQRLKTDLISNVSHDLKTPLTSIITYTDLLKKEGLDSPNAESYLKVIDEKGKRLKTLTEDLFEAAKASSGSIPVKTEKVDMLSLVSQGMVEMNDEFKEKGLEVIVKSKKDKYYVAADSQLLWRVVENLLNNVVKYALKNSRVYIDLNEEEIGDKSEKKVVLDIKNVSEASLNIPEDELMERFKRGDSSRSTEGSGLGLAIAKDLVKLQNGTFKLKIDGDLFKSTVVLDSFDEDKIKREKVLTEEKTEIEKKTIKIKESNFPKFNS